MTVLELQHEAMPHVKPTDTLKYAMQLMNQCACSWLAVVASGKFEGYIHKEDIEEHSKKSDLVEVLSWHYPQVFTHKSEHFWHITKHFSLNQIDCLAVLDEQGMYETCFSLAAFSLAYFQQFGNTGIGAIVALNLDGPDYSFSKIAAITEAENVKILQSNLYTYFQDDRLGHVLTLGLSQENIHAVVASFGRMGYQIKAVFSKHSGSNEDKQRLDNLFKYLEV